LSKKVISVPMMSSVSQSDFFGDFPQVEVERALAEFRAGRPVSIRAGGETAMALPIDGMTGAKLAAFRQLCAPQFPHLVVTGRRARALGIDCTGPAGLVIGEVLDAASIFVLAAENKTNRRVHQVLPAPGADAAIELAKLAHRLPALLMISKAAGHDLPIVSVAVEAIFHFRRAVAESLAIAAEATVPLSAGFSARFVVFREASGGSPVAVVVGRPDLTRPVAVRLHSACLTGDVFGSRRCDCGDQLRLALSQLQHHGGGIILYLEQEGRGLGLANKMRTYQLQEAGLDTVDANTVLGFDDDERDYGVAVRMLQALGCTRVRLLTNNPAKLEGLARAGIDIFGRLPLQGPVNADNQRYLKAKATRAGHQLEHVLRAVTKDPGES
jgi:GTP cyclohydrolase II